MFDIRLFFEKLKLSFQKRTKTAQTGKCYTTWQAKGYVKKPLVSIIIQSHNKSLQIRHILPKLRSWGGEMEIIVIDDGSELSHTQALAAAMPGANEFLIRSNDLYENITYDKTIRFANGQYIALLQDDDDFADTSWIDRALKLFREHPDMAVLGGKDGLDIVFEHDTRTAHGGCAVDKRNGFVFAVSVNRAPMWINKELFSRHLHHIDFDFAPFQFDDYELCARAWLENLQVGVYNAGFHSLSVGGMRLWNGGFTAEQTKRNGKRLYEKYADKIDEIHRKVMACNASLS
ncbi:MAG: glycosyltransferase [Bacteroidaceae bacterium]|nr:glycosyltransferase [Bacteroidaceae bacterium]